MVSYTLDFLLLFRCPLRTYKYQLSMQAQGLDELTIDAQKRIPGGGWMLNNSGLTPSIVSEFPA
jgi:hypothetical protein